MNATIEYLKCCGNCYHCEYKLIIAKHPMFCRLTENGISPWEFCDKWASDCLTREMRQVKNEKIKEEKK